MVEDALITVRGLIARAIAGYAERTTNPESARHAPSSHADTSDSDAMRVDRSAADTSALGNITLRPHQVDAVHRLCAALQAHGGALLADAPGLGKTFVALAVARRLGPAVVIAPAALRAQWRQSASDAKVGIDWCSVETLSRRPFRSDAPLLIVDEAHHLRTPSARRYAHVASLAVGKRVLLLSATPVHNRTTDRDALLALFFGSARPSPATLAQLIVRREASPALLPQRAATRWLTPPRTGGVGAAVRALPPPVPAADGREATELLQLGFAHAWSSSLAALDAMLRRALLQAAAIDDALADGRWPTRQQLRAWGAAEDAAQLAFASMVASPATADIERARTRLAAYARALRALRRRIATAREPDAVARAALMRHVLHTHPNATVVAFSRYAATVDAIWRALRSERGVVALTARGVRSAGGGLRRDEVLALLAAPDATRDARAPVRLVLCTELLGEGLNLRAASVIVHLDQPWTPARLEQREGRALRLGSPHQAVAVYAVRAPRGAQQMLALARRQSDKRLAMNAGLAAGQAREALLALVRPWIAAPTSLSVVAAVTALTSGWVAVIRDGRACQQVIAMTDDGIVADDVTLLTLLRQARRGAARVPTVNSVRTARREIRRWLRADASTALARAVDDASSVRATVARRLDLALQAAPLHHRTVLAPRIAAARTAISRLRGIGAEYALKAALRGTTVEEVLRAIEVINALPRDDARTRTAHRIVALLLFEPAAASIAPPQRLEGLAGQGVDGRRA